MNNALERRRREQAVIELARDVAHGHDMGDGMVEIKWDDIVHLRDALWNLDALELGPTDRVKSRGVECTSEMAAAFTHGRKAQELSGRILHFIYHRHLYQGCTVDELEIYTTRPHQSVSARVNELRDNGWLVDSGSTRQTRSGLDAVVWNLTGKARIMLYEARRSI